MRKKHIGALLYIAIFLVTLVLTYFMLTYLYPQKYSEYVKKYSQEFGIDENLVYAIIKCESNFKAEAISHAGAIGLMQITPDTLNWAAAKAKDTSITDVSIYDSEINIKYGCYIYSLFLNEFGIQKNALASYNAGRGHVIKWLEDSRYSDDGIILKQIPFDETEKYVKKVESTKEIYDLLY